MNMESIYKQSIEDLREDYEELVYLLSSNQFYLSKYLLQIKSVQKYLKPSSLQAVLAQTDIFQSHLLELLKDLIELKEMTEKSRPSQELMIKLTNSKDEYFDLIRSFSGTAGSIITFLDWQSPSFTHSLYSQAGKQTGKISGTINDYKRDVHLDEQEYEKLFLKEYVDSHLKYGIHTYMTNSGMAAFTTILTFLMSEQKLTGKILMGKSVYFQYKQILAGSFKDKIIEVEETDTSGIIQAIIHFKPCAIFMDSLCNAKSIPVPKLDLILDCLIKNSKTDVYFVVDNTCLSVFFQPFQKLIGRTKKVHLLLFESLMKYHHFGQDKTTGGIIVAWGKDTGKIFEYRKHAGTNIVDSSVYVFPRPNRKKLEARLVRLGRNALFLADKLQEYISNCHSPIEKIVYPGLSNHPSFDGTKNKTFRGSFFNLEFKKKTVRNYKQFINLAINEAKKKKIQLVGGTSFGLNSTRIYLTSLWTKFGEPFVRVSVGTENRWQLETLYEVFKSAIDKL